LKPAGGVYLQVAPNGKITMVTDVTTFTIKIVNDAFDLGAITYKKVK
jgi:competence protein ComGF